MAVKKAKEIVKVPHPGGRPRTVSFSDDEMVLLGQEMVEWCLANDPLHLSQWYTIHKSYTYKEWKCFIQNQEFFPYYEKALKIVGIKYLDGESKKVKDGISQRWQRVYFKDLKEEEDADLDAKVTREKELMDHAQKLKQEDTKMISDDVMNSFNQLSAQIAKAQSSALNIEESNNKQESKS